MCPIVNLTNYGSKLGVRTFANIYTLHIHSEMKTESLEFSGRLYLNFCENHGSLTAAVGLSPEIAISVAASGDLEVVVIKPFRCEFKFFYLFLVLVIEVHDFASTLLPYN